MFGWENSGFLMQYFVVGLVYGGLPATMYGVLNGYLNVPAYVYTAAYSMATLPWSFKAFFGALNDCVPIRGFRRKPYMTGGWALCTVALLILSATWLPPEPYWCRDVDGYYITECTEPMQHGARARQIGRLYLSALMDDHTAMRRSPDGLRQL